MTQDQALYLLNSGKNVYLTGAAGSGKTFVLNKFIGELRKKKIGVGVTASTGIAATHLGGMTIHSFAGIGIAKNLTEDQIAGIAEKRHVQKHFNDNDVLIIDEVSMLDASCILLVDAVAKAVRKSVAAFGGMQVVLCGDFFQLPPVSRKGEPPALFAYRSPVWKELGLATCYLTEQHRQKDNILASILNAIRFSRVDETVKNHLRGRAEVVLPAGNMTKLYCHNVDVDAENARELSKLGGTSKTYYMKKHGAPALLKGLQNGCLAPEELVVKEGAAVMFVKNNFDKGFVNGTLGTVEGFDDEGYPVIKSLQGRRFVASPENWKIEENGKTAASIAQIPLRLAWAITVHKSQGMTLDGAEINLAQAFEKGMGYVALSRVTSLEGIRLLGFNETALQVHEDVLAFDKKIQAESEVLARAISI